MKKKNESNKKRNPPPTLKLYIVLNVTQKRINKSRTSKIKEEDNVPVTCNGPLTSGLPLYGFWNPFMKQLKAMSINYENLIGVQASNLNCTIRKTLSHNKRSYPSRTEFTKNKLEARVVEEDFLPKGELLPRNHPIMECVCPFLVDSRAFIDLHSMFLQLL